MARILAIDPGSRRCGIAITDSDQTMAFPRPALDVNESLMGKIAQLVEDEAVGLIVVGRPLSLAGDETSSTDQADELFRAVQDRVHHATVIQWDERLTTVEAQRSLSGAGMNAKNQRAHVDSAAAVIMLQHYLDALSAD
ncbi:MAG: Holliday junction resolvase RuvX [Acidimicrobiales bacterium]